VPNASAAKPTYAELEVRCEQYRQIAVLNGQTIRAQQQAYNVYIAKLEKQLFDAVGQLRKHRGR
jgi:hypothetical protein